MSAMPSYPPIATLNKGPVPSIGDAASTPVPTQADDRRQDGQFVMPETLEQLDELFLRRLTATASAAQPARTPIRYDNAGQSGKRQQ